jgi:hypothetical protein
MTKEEFIQQATLTILATKPNLPYQNMVVGACSLSELVYGKLDEIKENMCKAQDAPANIYEKEGLGKLLLELDRIDVERRDKEKADYLKNGWRWSAQKAGFMTKVNNACKVNKITTIGELLGFGRLNFGRTLNVGKVVLAVLDEALLNLYGINAW